MQLPDPATADPADPATIELWCIALRTFRDLHRDADHERYRDAECRFLAAWLPFIAAAIDDERDR